MQVLDRGEPAEVVVDRDPVPRLELEQHVDRVVDRCVASAHRADGLHERSAGIEREHCRTVCRVANVFVSQELRRCRA
ncbi:MAG: hypothetical protein ACTHU0_08220 [Kofleriaceae bacterium]